MMCTTQSIVQLQNRLVSETKLPWLITKRPNSWSVVSENILIITFRNDCCGLRGVDGSGRKVGRETHARKGHLRYCLSGSLYLRPQNLGRVEGVLCVCVCAVCDLCLFVGVCFLACVNHSDTFRIVDKQSLAKWWLSSLLHVCKHVRRVFKCLHVCVFVYSFICVCVRVYLRSNMCMDLHVCLLQLPAVDKSPQSLKLLREEARVLTLLKVSHTLHTFYTDYQIKTPTSAYPTKKNSLDK